MSETSEPKLLPCAHCGEILIYLHCYSGFCAKCSGCGTQTDQWQYRSHAIAAWNRRANDVNNELYATWKWGFEQGRSIAREKPKWTKEPPTEEGWYWFTDAHNKPKMVYHKFGRVCFLADSSVCGPAHEYWTEDIEEFGENVQWLKINTPALPEEGGEQ